MTLSSSSSILTSSSSSTFRLENTLLDGSLAPRLKICDIGYSTSSVLHSQPKSTVGTHAYIASEVLLRQEYDGKVGNAVTDDYQDYIGTFEYWWTHGLISDSTYKFLRQACDLGSLQHSSTDCIKALMIAETEQGNIDPYIIYTRPCNSTLDLRWNLRGHYPWMSRAYDP